MFGRFGVEEVEYNKDSYVSIKVRIKMKEVMKHERIRHDQTLQ